MMLGVLLLVVAGCASPSADPSGSASTAESMLREARVKGADQSQIAILEKGEVGYPDYESAISRSLQCMRDIGISVIGPEPTNGRGIKELNYSWSPHLPGMTEDQGTALGDDCLVRYSYWVEMLWQLQPSSVEAMESYFNGFRRAVVGCISENGGAIRDDATRDEAVAAALEVRDKTDVNCFEESGISW
jgi:hypothetical protein